MIYRKLGKSDLNCSVIGLGTWAMGGDSYGKVDDDVSVSTILAGVDAGINLIDTAQPYGAGHSEEVVGRALKQLDRSKVIVATKFGSYKYPETGYFRDGSVKTLREGLEGSLKRLGTDYIDLYQCHWPCPNVPIEETFTEIEKMRKEGKIRYIGVSNFSPEEMDEVQKYCTLTSLQPPYSLLDRPFEKELEGYCLEKGIGVLSYGSIGAGVLTGKYKERPVFPKGDTRNENGFYKNCFSEENWPKVSALVDVLREVAEAHNAPVVHAAINWVLANPSMTVALVGAKTPEQVRMNAAAGSWELSTEEKAKIDEAAKPFAVK